MANNKKSRPGAAGNGIAKGQYKGNKKGIHIKYIARLIGTLPVIDIFWNGTKSTAVLPFGHLLNDSKYMDNLVREIVVKQLINTNQLNPGSHE